MVRIVLSVTLLVIVAAGCGSGDGSRKAAVHGVPRALAQAWEGQASAIASAAAAGNNCRALHLAASLRDDVVSSQLQVPSRLRPPLVTTVNALADRITCTPVVTKPTPPHEPPQGPKPKPSKPPHHHEHGGDKGDGNHH